MVDVGMAGGDAFPFEPELFRPLKRSEYDRLIGLGVFDDEREVADSTLRKDRRKAAVYASASIAEYWIVNLGARTVEVYASPEGDRYAEVRTLRTGDTLRPRALLDVALAVAEILPKA